MSTMRRQSKPGVAWVRYRCRRCRAVVVRGSGQGPGLGHGRYLCKRP